VLTLVESITRAAPADLAKTLADIAAAAALITAMPTVNAELWAKLARAARAARCTTQAFDCASKALAVLPGGGDAPLAIARASDVPARTPNDWFWLSVAYSILGHTVLASTKGGAAQARRGSRTSASAAAAAAQPLPPLAAAGGASLTHALLASPPPPPPPTKTKSRRPRCSCSCAARRWATRPRRCASPRL
jgi:hypothetical protein